MSGVGQQRATGSKHLKDKGHYNPLISRKCTNVHLSLLTRHIRAVYPVAHWCVWTNEDFHSGISHKRTFLCAGEVRRTILALQKVEVPGVDSCYRPKKQMTEKRSNVQKQRNKEEGAYAFVVQSQITVHHFCVMCVKHCTARIPSGTLHNFQLHLQQFN